MKSFQSIILTAIILFSFTVRAQIATVKFSNQLKLQTPLITKASIVGKNSEGPIMCIDYNMPEFREIKILQFNNELNKFNEFTLPYKNEKKITYFPENLRIKGNQILAVISKEDEKRDIKSYQINTFNFNGLSTSGTFSAGYITKKSSERYLNSKISTYSTSSGYYNPNGFEDLANAGAYENNIPYFSDDNSIIVTAFREHNSIKNFYDVTIYSNERKYLYRNDSLIFSENDDIEIVNIYPENSGDVYFLGFSKTTKLTKTNPNYYSVFKFNILSGKIERTDIYINAHIKSITLKKVNGEGIYLFGFYNNTFSLNGVSDGLFILKMDSMTLKTEIKTMLKTEELIKYGVAISDYMQPVELIFTKEGAMLISESAGLIIGIKDVIPDYSSNYGNKNMLALKSNIGSVMINSFDNQFNLKYSTTIEKKSSDELFERNYTDQPNGRAGILYNNDKLYIIYEDVKKEDAYSADVVLTKVNYNCSKESVVLFNCYKEKKLIEIGSIKKTDNNTYLAITKSYKTFAGSKWVISKGLCEITLKN
jgi:hypothetical protein